MIYHLPEREIPVYSSLREAEKLLLDRGCEKCNSCYLVNLRHVKGIKDNYALVGNEMLQISRARKSFLYRHWLAILEEGKFLKKQSGGIIVTVE